MSGGIRFPFRLTPSGTVATAPYGSDAEVNDALFAALHTHMGERPLSPQFGISDPAGLGIDEVVIESDLATMLTETGFDDVSIKTVTLAPVTNTLASATIEWERDDEDMGPTPDDEED